MNHEKTVEFDVEDKKGRKRHIVTPSVGKDKGKTLGVFSSREAAKNFAVARSSKGHSQGPLNPSGSAFSRPSGGRLRRRLEHK